MHYSLFLFFFKQKTAYDMRISDWSSDVCSSDLVVPMFHVNAWGLPYTSAMVGVKLVFPGPALDGVSLHELLEDEHVTRSEERRVGKEGVSTCRSRWSP